MGLTVALPTSSFLPAQGGAEIGLHHIASQLVRKGHRPLVIASHTHVRELRHRGWRLPYDVAAYPPRLSTWRLRYPSVGRPLMKQFHGLLQHRKRFDVWHATFGVPTGIAVIEFCRERGIPHLVRCVGDDIQVHPAIGYGMRLDPDIDREVRTWLPRSQRVVATTETVAEEYRALNIPPHRIAQIPNGIDLERFTNRSTRNDVRARLQTPRDAILFLAVGRNHPKKNFSALIAAAARMRGRAVAPFQVAIVGAGVAALASEVEAFEAGSVVRLCETPAAEHGIGGVGAPLLPSDEILDFYFSADVFVMPSLVETFGIVAVEAMGAGLPVAAADSPGCRDVIRGGKDGLLYDGSVDTLVEAMTSLMDSELRRRYADLSRTRAKDFDWAHIVDRYVGEYRTLIAESSWPMASSQ